MVIISDEKQTFETVLIIWKQSVFEDSIIELADLRNLQIYLYRPIKCNYRTNDYQETKKLLMAQFWYFL